MLSSCRGIQKFVNDPAAAEHQKTIRHTKQFRHVFRRQENRKPSIHQVPDQLINLQTRTDIHTARRIIEQQKFWARGQTFPDHDFLQITAGEGAARRIDARSFNPDARDQFASLRDRFSPVKEWSPSKGTQP
jgi:hypothetical protein